MTALFLTAILLFQTAAEGRCFLKGFDEDFGVADLSAHLETSAYRRSRESEIFDALVLGVRDYIGKSGFKKAHLGLSGGIDSALVAVIAAKAIGPENVTCFALPSRFSSETSFRDARELAENLGVHFDSISIESLYKEYLDVLSPVFRGTEPDTTEENIQARIRGDLLMAYSNKKNSILLMAGNKSEFATGYCTLYGDMCGAIAVLGDVFKTEVYRVCRYINEKEKLIPESILVKAPSAELKENQTDQDTLPPYDTLDAILDLYIMKNYDPKDIVAAGFEEAIVKRVVKMVNRAEYKRRQAPPVIKVSERAFGADWVTPLVTGDWQELNA